MHNFKIDTLYVESVEEAIVKIKQLIEDDVSNRTVACNAFGLTEQTEDSIQLSKENGDFEETGGYYEWYNIDGEDIMDLIDNEEDEPITPDRLRSDWSEDYTDEDSIKEDYKDYYIYLENLRNSGATNMLEAVPYLMKDFNITKELASHVLWTWLLNYYEISKKYYKGEE